MSAYQRTGDDPASGVMTVQDFAALGFGETAYIKPVLIDGRQAFAIHAANGVPIAAVTDRDLAVVYARQNDLEAVSVH